MIVIFVFMSNSIFVVIIIIICIIIVGFIIIGIILVVVILFLAGFLLLVPNVVDFLSTIISGEGSALWLNDSPSSPM